MTKRRASIFAATATAALALGAGTAAHADAAPTAVTAAAAAPEVIAPSDLSPWFGRCTWQWAITPGLCAIAEIVNR